MISKKASIPFFSLLTCVFCFSGATASAADCSYFIGADSLVVKKAVPANAKFKISVHLPSNVDHQFYAIKKEVAVGAKGLAAGSSIAIPQNSIEVHLDQVDALAKNFATGQLGLSAVVDVPQGARGVLARAATGFLSVSAGSGIILQEPNYGNAKTSKDKPLFDPRALTFNEKHQNNIKLENDNVALQLTVERKCKGEAAPAEGQAPGV